MTQTTELAYSNFILPASVISRVDVSRMVVNAEKVDNALTTASVHEKVGITDSIGDIITEQFEEFLSLNKLEFQTNLQRSELIKQLRLLKDNVPIVTMTFAVEADRESLSQLAVWLRENVHKQAVIAVGLQPALVAGVYLRTSNQVLDLSLRAKLAGSRDILFKQLEASRG